MGIGPFLVALGVRWLLGPILEDRAPYLLFALAVVAASIYGGRFPALLSTLLGAGAGIHFIDSFRPAAMAKNIRLERAGQRTGLLSADPDRVRQILWNLLSNALRFTPRGGRILVSLDATKTDVTLRVQDDGPGIPWDVLPHVFERYCQSREARGGLGLGLALARELAELHGGTIHAGNVGPEGGARFDVVLPRHAPVAGDHSLEDELEPATS